MRLGYLARRRFDVERPVRFGDAVLLGDPVIGASTSAACVSQSAQDTSRACAASGSQSVVRQDSASGFYEELNAPSSRLSADAANLQTALLAPPRTSRIADVIVCTVMAVLLAAALVHWWSS